jgi:prepilin-type N-terminal cleavage/methylation domain-containing protein
MEKRAFSLLEVMITVIIIGILATLATVQYGTYKESAFDKEAQTNLRLIIAAQRIYRMEAAAYYPPASGTVTDIPTINRDLKLYLSNASNRNWNYSTTSNNAGPSACAQATRTAAPVRRWRFRSNDNNEPDPVLDNCP